MSHAQFRIVQDQPAKVRRRDEVDAVRTMLWYEQLRFWTGCRGPAELERLVEPGLFAKAKEELYHSNKWYGYAYGLHTPRRALLELAERTVPEAVALEVFDHVLWTALRTERQLGRRVKRMLRSLGSELESILYRRTADGAVARRRPITVRLLNQVEALPFLDALAALTIVLREASEKGRLVAARQFLERILRVLLIFSTMSHVSIASSLLYQIYLQRVFPLATGRPEEGIDFRDYDFSAASGLLLRLFLRAEDAGTLRPRSGHGVRFMRRLLRGRLGLQWKWRLMTPLYSGLPLEIADPRWPWSRQLTKCTGTTPDG